jgi:hypothetical protein
VLWRIDDSNYGKPDTINKTAGTMKYPVRPATALGGCTCSGLPSPLRTSGIWKSYAIGRMIPHTIAGVNGGMCFCSPILQGGTCRAEARRRYPVSPP